MRVNPNSQLLSATDIPARSKAPAPGLGRDQLTVGSTDDLEGALQGTPLARPDEVARATDLVQDDSYPSAEVIGGIASILAQQITPNEPQQPV
ncbi:MAG: hypothetical protein ACLQVX_10825 [Limisphaerales bacterium]